MNVSAEVQADHSICCVTWSGACGRGSQPVSSALQVPTMHQILLSRAEKDYPRGSPPPLRFIRSCSSSLAAPTLHKLEAAFGVPVLEVHP